MIKVTIKETKRFDQNALTRDVLKHMQGELSKMLQEKLQDVRCPEHGTVPEMQMDFREDNKCHFTILNNCCKAFTQQINDQLQP